MEIIRVYVILLFNICRIKFGQASRNKIQRSESSVNYVRYRCHPPRYVESEIVYPIMMIGRVSLCNYSILGSLRSISQIISFEILLFLVFFLLIILIEDYSFYIFVKFQYNIISFYVSFIYYFCY